MEFLSVGVVRLTLLSSLSPLNETVISNEDLRKEAKKCPVRYRYVPNKMTKINLKTNSSS